MKCDFDTMKGESMFRQMIERLPKEPTENVKFWATDEEILGKDDAAINHIADLLDALGYCSATGYYDPAEDERMGETDMLTGYYYVTI